MKQKSERQHAGICLDNNHAIIIANDNEEKTYAIREKVKANETHGGGSEHSMNNSKHGENQKFFKIVAGIISHYDEILIFGSGNSQEQFHNYLKKDAQFNNKQITVDSTGNQTDPQMIAQVRDFFSNRN